MANDPTLAEMKTGAFIGEIYSKNAIMHTMSNLVVTKCVNHDYRSELQKGAKIWIPVFSEVSSGAVTAGTELTAQDAVNATPKSITVDQWYGVRIEESEMETVQDHVGYLEKAAQSCGYAIAKTVDTALGALFSGLGGYTADAYGTDGQTLSDDIILALMETLDEGDVPDDGTRVIITDPSNKSDLLKIDKFVRNDYVKNPVVQTGQFGNIYNMKVLITNNLTAASTGNYGVMMHRDALGAIIQKEPYVQRVPMPWEHQIIYQVKVLYGVGELIDGFGVPFFTRSS